MSNAPPQPPPTKNAEKNIYKTPRALPRGRGRKSAVKQIFGERRGAGDLPPRRMNSPLSTSLTGITGAEPSRPPKLTSSPTVLPGTGMTRTAVVLLLTTPIAHSSAMIAEIVSAEVSPGSAIMSRPTEHTAVIASSLDSDSLPARTAFIMPASSLTGINAPDSPPTIPDAMTPPFLTASLSSASAAVVP